MSNPQNQSNVGRSNEDASKTGKNINKDEPTAQKRSGSMKDDATTGSNPSNKSSNV